MQYCWAQLRANGASARWTFSAPDYTNVFHRCSYVISVIYFYCWTSSARLESIPYVKIGWRKDGDTHSLLLVSSCASLTFCRVTVLSRCQHCLIFSLTVHHAFIYHIIGHVPVLAFKYGCSGFSGTRVPPGLVVHFYHCSWISSSRWRQGQIQHIQLDFSTVNSTTRLSTFELSDLSWRNPSTLLDQCGRVLTTHYKVQLWPSLLSSCRPLDRLGHASASYAVSRQGLKPVTVKCATIPYGMTL